MMLSGGHEQPQNFLKIKQDDKFFTRLLSKERSKAESSFRLLYYGGASGAIPFLWESQPGTPKHKFSDTPRPPLTPPPSYQSTSSKRSMQIQKRPKPNFLHTIFSRMGSKKNHHVSPSLSVLSSSSISSSSSSLSSSSPSTPMNPNAYGHRRCFSHSSSSSRSTTHFGVHDEEKQPTLTMCFGSRHGISRDFGGQYSKLKVKKVLLSMIGHGTA